MFSRDDLQQLAEFAATVSRTVAGEAEDGPRKG